MTAASNVDHDDHRKERACIMPGLIAGPCSVCEESGTTRGGGQSSTSNALSGAGLKFGEASAPRNWAERHASHASLCSMTCNTHLPVVHRISASCSTRSPKRIYRLRQPAASFFYVPLGFLRSPTPQEKRLRAIVLPPVFFNDKRRVVQLFHHPVVLAMHRQTPATFCPKETAAIQPFRTARIRAHHVMIRRLSSMYTITPIIQIAHLIFIGPFE
ncbi:hypothetical protein B0J11DRAFT_203452 [Dendryphion nanum]|uniref:Uncharacterized protein n=1 Tax=Dendryphion nanum TaxID=256645 RepID=A0A9P9D1D9_9PLEO|nr:hypothetical protein B0J11DRAFT_203452 [Dendryphion nanum]